MTSIFVSHAWADDFTQEVCARLADRVAAYNGLPEGERKGTFELFRDEECIDEACEWRPKIYEWLARCEGAIIFLSSAAMESKWVKFEASIFAWRRALKKEFKVLPVLLGVEQKALSEGDFAPSLLGEIKPLIQKDGESADDLVDRIMVLLGHPWTGSDCGMSQWIRKVKGQVRCATDPHCLHDTLKVLEANDGLGMQEPESAVAYLLLHARREKMVTDALWVLVDGIRDRLKFNKLKLLLHPNWVKLPVAARLRAVAERALPTKRNVGFNVGDFTIGKSCIDRALCCSDRKYVIQGPVHVDMADLQQLRNDSESDVEQPAVIEQWGLALREAFGDLSLSYEELREELEDLDAPLFFLISEGMLHPELLPKLRRLYPPATFLLFQNGQCPDAKAVGLEPGTLERIEFDDGEEKAGRAYMRHLNRIPQAS